MDVELRHVGKSYSGVPVLRDVSMRIQGPRIHGLVGENGAGKSTLLRILCGDTAADTGTMTIDGRLYSPRSPRYAIATGLSLISQEVTLVPELSVLDNVFLGDWAHRWGVVGKRPDRAKYAEVSSRTGFRIDPATLVSRLSLAQQQQVEIMRALVRGSALIAMDEPTALLPRNEAAALMDLVGSLRDDGVTIVLISHFLDEVLERCDSLTVLRDGELVRTAATADFVETSLVRDMVGRPLDVVYPSPPPVGPGAPARVVLEGVTTRSIHDVSLSVRAGEIVGLAGLVGAGRSAVLRSIFGSDRVVDGTISVLDPDGTADDGGSTGPHRAVSRGVGLIPEDRKHAGLVLDHSVLENAAIASLPQRQTLGWIHRRAERAAVDAAVAAVDLRGDRPRVSVEQLSGGNQQKVLFAKWLLVRPNVLLIDEPTRGVDIAAKVKIHEVIVQLAAEGVAILLVSSDLDELIALSHRLLVLRSGRIQAEFDGAIDRETVISRAFGVVSETTSRSGPSHEQQVPA